ncbi:hypothetical protein Trydic_g14510 [Trypoxylus dichotomus]
MEFEVITRYIKQEASRIRRPANAFMLYANHNRKKMAQMYPLESNKEISKRLGNSWKKLDSVEKLHYYDLAKQVDMEHKRKYPERLRQEKREQKFISPSNSDLVNGTFTIARRFARFRIWNAARIPLSNKRRMAKRCEWDSPFAPSLKRRTRTNCNFHLRNILRP